MNTDCIFCKVIAGTVPSTKILETDSILVVKDIAPKAPYHYLIMPKKHLQDLRDLTHDDYALAAEMLMVTKKLAQELPKPGDFNLIANNGKNAGQVVMHMHFHFIAGKKVQSVN